MPPQKSRSSAFRFAVQSCLFGTLILLFQPLLAAPPPNVVVLLADDLGWHDLSCYGSAFCETPNIDQLARQGVRFTNAYSAGSICSPTRASLMTGKYPPRTGVTDYIPGLDGADQPLATPRTATQLSLSEETLGEIFKAAGFQTFYSGKWHLGGNGFEPTQQGFDVYVSDDELGSHARDWKVGQRITESFEDFLNKRNVAQPFLAYLAFHEPHLPILEYPKHIERFRRKARIQGQPLDPIKERDGLTRPRQDAADYGSEVAGLDDCVGNVIASLEQKQLRDNTIVVFFSDNGGLSTKAAVGPTNNSPLRAGKGWLYEGGIRVPCIVSLPKLVGAGLVTDQPVISMDILPTLLDLTGIGTRIAAQIDGRSFASIVSGETKSLPPRELFWHYPHYHGSTWAPGAAMRDGDWKLVELQHYGDVELFNLREDVSESHNLAAEHPEVVAKMMQRLASWQTEVGAKFAVPRNLQTDELVAWCIVPFDASQRGPQERAKMLRELGLKRMAYDWREEHVATWDAELDATKEHGIEFTAFWCSSSLDPPTDPAVQRIVDFLKRRKLATQLWVMLPENQLSKIADEQVRVEAAANAIRLLADQVQSLGCKVGLYNHGGWIGKPQTLVKIMETLRETKNVGIVYNFHHAHEELSEFPAALELMKPYLLCLNLNGTTPAGPKIQPLGSGTLDAQILRWIRQADYQGPIGILDHRPELDAQESLQQNLDGLKKLLRL